MNMWRTLGRGIVLTIAFTTQFKLRAWSSETAVTTETTTRTGERTIYIS